MSDATVETAVATPVETAPAATETPNLSAAERRADIRNRAAGKVTQQTHHSATQPRDQVGKFAADTSPATETAAQAPAVNATAEPVKASVTERIELPENDPLRARGKQYFDELAPHEIRSFINRAQKASQLDATQAELNELRAKLARAEAATAGWQEQTASVLSNPLMAEKYARLKEWDADAAEEWLAGVNAKLQGAVETKVKEVDVSLAEQNAQREAQSFLNATREASLNRYPQWWTSRPEFDAAFKRAGIQYATELELTGQNYEPNGFFEYMDKLFVSDPYAKSEAQKIRAQREAETLRNAQAELQRKQTEEANAHQARLRANPLARLPAAANTNQSIPVHPVETAAQRRQRIHDRATGRVRA